MSKTMPPVPPGSQSDKGPKSPRNDAPTDARIPDPHQRNLAEQGRQGNVKQNTTNKGHQQDR
ncbi:hypothetical protein [Paracoccus beibuensis]|uniref:hypothetical protein n=1 Tax=Paracoccus beibuensis TaxID=547602 RepID=UPI00223EDE8D|nr:hypothetical protein [Paracoccus beibuensis]